MRESRIEIARDDEEKESEELNKIGRGWRNRDAFGRKK